MNNNRGFIIGYNFSTPNGTGFGTYTFQTVDRFPSCKELVDGIKQQTKPLYPDSEDGVGVAILSITEVSIKSLNEFLENE